MYCINCGKKIDDGIDICPYCAAKQKNVIIKDNNIQEQLNENTVVLHDPQSTVVLDQDQIEAASRSTVILGKTAEEKISFERPQESTESIFNDIQESLAHQNMNFENNHRENMNKNPGPDKEKLHHHNQKQSQSSRPEDDDDLINGNKLKQKNTVWIIAGTVAAVVTIILLCVIASLMKSAANQMKQDYANQIKQGEDYMSDEDYDSAIEAFKEAIKIDGEEEDAYLKLAEAYMKNKDYRKAAEVLSEGSRNTGHTKRITQKQDELFQLAPQLRPEYQTNNSAQNGSQHQAPQTQPPTTEAPQTQPPTTEAPQTQPPTTEAPQTQPPTTEEPQTQPPTTEAPQTQPPTTEAPQTQPPATEAPQTQPPSTEAPQTQPPATEAPETQPPTTEEPQTQPPSTEAPETQPPTTEVPESESSEPDSNEETDETEEKLPVIGDLTYEVNNYYHETKLPDGSVGAYTEISYPYFPEDKDAAKVMNTYFEKFLKEFGENEKKLENYEGEEELKLPLYDKAQFTLTYADHGYVSMKYIHESNDGSGNIVIKDKGVIINQETGAVMKWQDILYGHETDIEKLIKTHYDTEANKDISVNDFIKALKKDWTNIYLTDQGLCFIADVNEKHKGIVVTIPYSESQWFKFLNDTDPTKESESEE